MSAKEERDLQALLDRFAMEVGDIEDFQQRLQDELAALEVPWPGVQCSTAIPRLIATIVICEMPKLLQRACLYKPGDQLPVSDR